MGLAQTTTPGLNTPGSQTVKEERGVPLPVAIGIIVALFLVLVGGGVAVGYRYFWNGFSGPRVWDAQVAQWQLALKKNPKDVEGWAELGYAFLQKGELGEAEKAYKKALQLDPKAVELNYFLGQIKMKQHKYAEAEKLFKKVADIAPGNPLPHYALAEAYMQQRKYDLALDRLNYILEKIDPTLVEVLHLRGAALEAKKQREQAIASYKDALRYDPAYQPARDALHRLGIKDSELPQMPAEVGRPGQIVRLEPTLGGGAAGGGAAAGQQGAAQQGGAAQTQGGQQGGTQ